MTEVLRVAVLSDIHAGEPEHGDTFVVAEPPDSRPNENPLRDLLLFSERRGLKADLLLCPGDLGNRAHAVGRMYGWNALQQLGTSFGASVVATVGNHDVETRTSAADQAQLLKTLSPPYPVDDPTAVSAYWQDGYYLDDSDSRYRILNLNTCADFPPFPGPDPTPDQLDQHRLLVERGSVSQQRLAAIEASLAGLDEKPVNIALMHHHPVEHARHDLFKDGYGPAANGEKLLDVLESSSHCGRWLIVHGHKHIPNFTVDGGSAHSPMVLCAASVGGHLWQPIAAVARNQFHIIEFDVDRVLGLPITRGRVRSWAWSFGNGWAEAPPTTGLPAEFGFGALQDAKDLADQVRADLVDSGAEFMRWAEIAERYPGVRYLGPRDFELFEERLEHGDLLLERTRTHVVTTIARRASWS